ncbi:glycosyltransferase [Methanobacterium sp. MBAC-LM]|uniref:glycosyltransferase n=1 Tax=Methanobacterium sp. MBAC-LM TaxID=3412034 RepID=UPI003C70A186
MKILIISDSLALGGGAEKFAVSLGNEFQKNHEIYHLTSFDDDPKYDFKGEYLTFKEDRSKNILSKIKNFFIMSYKIKRICKKKEIDIIIGVGEVANFRAILSRYLFKNKVKVFASHHLYPETHRINIDRIKFLYPKADKVICVSKIIEKVLNKKYGLNNLLTIYNMINIQSNLKNADNSPIEKYKEILAEKFVFISIGRLSFQKGQWYLIRSFKEVTNKYADAKLFILGDGDLKSPLTEMILDLNLENNVFLLGNQKNVYPFLQMSKCFVLTSLFEGFPLTLIETLSMDLPIISVDCKTGPRECLCPGLDLDEEINYPYFGEYGVLIEPFEKKWKSSKDKLNNKEQILSDLMIKFIEDPNLRNNYINGLKRAKNFDKNLIMDKWEKLFTE